MSIDQTSSRDRAKLDLELLESSLRATVPWNRDRKCYRPTGDWAMHVSQQDIVPGISAEQVDQANRSWDSLESHAIPGVMLCGLSIVHKETTSQKKERKDRPSELA